MLKKVEQIKKKMAFPVTQWEATAERKKQVASQVKMEARIGVRSQGMPDAETFNRKFKNVCRNWHLPFSTLTKKAIQAYFNFFLVKVVVCFVLLFFLAKIKVAIFVRIYEQIIKNVRTYNRREINIHF